MRKLSSLKDTRTEAETIRFLCMLDSDDCMHPTRVYEQSRYMLKRISDQSQRESTLLGCTFDRDPPDSTWHYAQWANGLSDERLSLEIYREVTLIQPTWFMSRSWFTSLGGYLEAPHPKKGTATLEEYLEDTEAGDTASSCLKIVHPAFETVSTLRVAEDLRFFYAHLHAGGHLRLLRHETCRSKVPLVTYRHHGFEAGQKSQSSNTSRRLLLHLRVLAFERCVLRVNPHWQQSDFCVWGAGRDGKDFIKALSPDLRQRVACIADVDPKKINTGYYVNREIKVRIPIVHFSLLCRDPAVRERLSSSFENGKAAVDQDGEDDPGFGRINKGKAVVSDSHESKNGSISATLVPPPTKKRRLHSVRRDDLDVELLPSLPVVVCVSMYRTGGALEHNVKMIGRTEGKDLWHLC